MPDLASDRDAIRDLLARYTYHGDRGRIDDLAACFAPDGAAAAARQPAYEHSSLRTCTQYQLDLLFE